MIGIRGQGWSSKVWRSYALAFIFVGGSVGVGCGGKALIEGSPAGPVARATGGTSVSVGAVNTGGSAQTGGSGGAVTLCGTNQRVEANACVACGARTTNAAGDDPQGANTQCDAEPPSCQGLAANCAGENCCTSPTVTGGMFNRGNDANSPATVSSFRLDKYEVTVGRFRNFVDAVVGGWTPGSGSGKHTHLNGGAGLANTGGGFEPGWDTAWNANLPADKATWDESSYLGCDATYQTWTPSSGGNETKPINCVNWYQSAAFCIWDGGFLPSEPEWNYAAASGNQQREYPWSSPANSMTIDCSYANYYGGAGFCVAPPNGYTSVVGSVSPKGNGRYGQADLAGNVYEWNLDWYAVYAATCNNCANQTVASDRVMRGGSFDLFASFLLSSYRLNGAPDYRNGSIGLRCARTP